MVAVIGCLALSGFVHAAKTAPEGATYLIPAGTYGWYFLKDLMAAKSKNEVKNSAVMKAHLQNKKALLFARDTKSRVVNETGEFLQVRPSASKEYVWFQRSGLKKK